MRKMPAIGVRTAGLLQWQVALAALGTALLAFSVCQRLTEIVAAAPALVGPWLAFVIVTTLVLASVRTVSLPDFGRRFVNGAAILIAVQFALDPFIIPIATLPVDHPAVLLYRQGRWVGLVLALVGWARPSALFAATMLLWLMREMSRTLTGLVSSTLDIRIVCEVVVFVCLGLSLLWGLATSRARTVLPGLDKDMLRAAALMIIAAAIGAHVGNYLASAVAKLALDGGILSWLRDNRIADIMAVGLEKQTLPSYHWPAATDLLYRGALAAAVPINLAAFAVQAAGPVAVLKRRWLIGLTLAFDLFHLVVFVMSGLFFWKWIGLNIVIVTTLLAISDAEWRSVGRWVTLVFVLAGSLVFHTAWLAWYDSRGFGSPYFVAHFADGEAVRMPSHAFRTASYQVSQAQFYWPAGNDHFNRSTWGSATSWSDTLAGRRCRVPDRSPPPSGFGSAAAIGRFMQARHRQMLTELDAGGRLRAIFVPHHHVASFGNADPLAGRDLRQITSYDFVLDSICVGIQDGHLTRRVIARTVIPVYDAWSDRITAR